MERYSRQTMLPQLGEAGQARLREARVLLVGVGGLGCPAAIYLAGAGVGHIGLLDPDVVSMSNLQRQTLYAESQIGMPKPLAAAERLRSMNSEVTPEPLCEGLTAANAAGIISRYDVVVDCCDNFATRYLIDDTCADTGRPWIHGAISEFSGQVTVLNHRHGRRYAELYPDREYLCALPRATAGVIGAVPGIIGSLQACEAIKLIADFGKLLEGRLLVIDCLDMNTQIIEY